MNKNNVLLKAWRVIYPLLTHIGITFFISIVGILLISFKIIFNTDVDITDIYGITEVLMDQVVSYSVLMTLVSGAIALPVLYLFYKWDIRRKGFKEVFRKPSILEGLVLIILAVLSCFAFNNILTMSNLIEMFPGYEDVSKALFEGNIIIQIITVVIIAPIVEELLFRGLIQKRLCEDMKAKYGILISAFLFAVYHMNVVQGLYAFAIGLLLGYTLEKYKTLLAPIIFHMVANGVSVLMVETSLLDFLYANDLVIIISTIVEVILILLIILWIEKGRLLDK